MASLAITWFGHATFMLTTPGGKRVVFDPWLTGNPKAPAGARIDVGTAGQVQLDLGQVGADHRPLGARHLGGRQQGHVRGHHAGLRVTDLGAPVDEQLGPRLGHRHDDADHRGLGGRAAARHAEPADRRLNFSR